MYSHLFIQTVLYLPNCRISAVYLRFRHDGAGGPFICESAYMGGDPDSLDRYEAGYFIDDPVPGATAGASGVASAVMASSVGASSFAGSPSTGIGGSAPQEEAPIKIVDETYGGKLRPVTAEDLKHTVDYDEPAFMRRRKVAGGSMGSSFGGFDSEAIDESDLDVPTFLRRKAD